MLAYIIGGNDMTRTVGALVILAIGVMAQAASGAEIKVYSTIGVKSALEDLAPKFEKATGNKLNITWGLISAFTKKAQEGDVPDVLVVSRASIDSLTKDGKIAANQCSQLPSSAERRSPIFLPRMHSRLRCSQLAPSATPTLPLVERAASILQRCSSVWGLPPTLKPRANFRRRPVLSARY